MIITQELIKTIYDRAYQYISAKRGETPDSIELDEDGTINANYVIYQRCGDIEHETEYINIDNLTEDLDAVIEQRKIKEKEEWEKRQIALKLEKEKEELRLKNNRRAEYLKLKKEFE